MNPLDKDPVSYTGIDIQGSFYAIRNTPKGTKLVKAKQSPMNLAQRMYREQNPLTPSVGKRPRIKHRSRTCAKLNREVQP